MRLKLLLISFALVGSAAAQLPPLPDSMLDESCTVSAAFDNAIISQLHAQSKRRDLMMANLEKLMLEMGSIDMKVGERMVDQMTAEEAARFEELSQKINAAQVVELIEGKRERDLWAIIGISRLTDQLAKEEFNQDSLSERDQIYLAFMGATEELLTLDEDYYMAIPEQGACDLENALHIASLKALNSMSNVYGWEQASVDLQAMSKKYGGLDRDTLSAADRERLERDILPVINQLNIRSDYRKMLYRLALIESMSKIRYRAMKMDQYDAPGDIDYMGTNWERMVVEKPLTESETIAAQILYQLDEVIPASVMEVWEQMPELPGED